MDYKPSRTFVIRGFVILAIAAGWLYFANGPEREHGALVYTAPTPTKLKTFASLNLAVGTTTPHGYGLAIKHALAPLEGVRENELDLLLTGKFATLGVLAEKYSATADALHAIQAPDGTQEIQRELVMAFGKFAELSHAMAQANENPIGALTAGKDFEKTTVDLEKTFQALNAYFAKTGTTFNAKDKINFTLYVSQ